MRVKYIIAIVFTTTIIALGLMITPTQAALQTNERIAINENFSPQYIPCANGGQGENAVLSGYIHYLYTVTFDKSGGLHLQSLENLQGVVLTGEITGDVWHGQGIFKQSYNFAKGQSTAQSVAINFNFVGRGSTPNLNVHANFHFTITPDGKVTATPDNFKITCK